MVLQHRDTAYGLTLIWALVAVYEKTGSPMVSEAEIYVRMVIEQGTGGEGW